MGLTLWTPVFEPGGRFIAPRSYFAGFSFRWIFDAVWINQSNPFVMYSPSTTITFHIKLKDVFYVWNSNSYTLDWIFDEAWGQVGGGPEVNLGSPVVRFVTLDPDRFHFLEVGYAAYSDTFSVALPPSPTDYWLANPNT